MTDQDDRLAGVPDADEGPLEWNRERGEFVASTTAASATPAGRRAVPLRADATGDDRRVRIDAPAGQRLGPPPRPERVVVEPSPATAPTTGSVTTGPRPADATSTSTATSPPLDRVRIAAPSAPAESHTPPTSPPTRSPGRPTGPQTPKTGSWRERWPTGRILRVGGIAIVSAIVVSLLVGWLQFRRIERIDLSAQLASGNGTNYLIVGSDTREGVDPNDPDAGAILGESTGEAERSDTILILRIAGGSAQMLSIPRDLYLQVAETGQRQRINAAFNGGPTRLIATLESQLGIPIHHYLEVDFVSFRDLVDGVGGITIDFPNPAIDTHSGLDIPEAGPQTLDGTEALAFVRSRYYTEIIDGRQRPDPTGDLGRTARQQQFLAAVLDKVGGTRNPFALLRVTNALVAGLTIDDDLSYFDALGLLRRMRGLDPAPTALPVSNFRTSAGAAVLRLVQPDADAILAQFGSTGSKIG